MGIGAVMKLYLTVSVAALTLGLAACDSFPQPQYPVAQQGSQPAAAQAYAPDPAPQPQPQAQAQPVAPQDNGVQAKPTTGIQQSTLPPPPGAKTAPTRKSSGASSGLDRSPYLMDAVWRPKEGARLWLAAVHHKKKAAPAPEEKTETVVVGKGDTLASIARTDNTTVEALAKANGLKKPYRLTAGQTIKLPGGQGTEVASDEAPAKPKKGAKAAPEKPAAAKEMTVGKGDTLASISKKTGVSIDDLAAANGLKSPYRLKQGQTLKVGGEAEEAPAPKSSSKGKAKAPARDEVGEIAQDSGASTITVRRKDTIQSLAKQAHVTVAELARLNHLKKPYRLKPGQQIKLPDNPTPSSGRSSSSRGEDVAPAKPRSVTVGRHDTLQSLAQKEGVSVETLAKLNHLKKPYRVKRGQTLRLPVQEAAEAPESRTPSNYAIKSGDTLYSLARKFGTTPKALAEANGLEPGARLTVGRRIHVPGAEPEEHAAPVRPRVPRVPPTEQPAQPVPYNALPSNPPVSSAPGLAPPPVLPPPTTSTPNPPYPVTPVPRDGGAAPYRPTPPAAEATPPGDAEIAALGKGLFQWPVKGDILQRFGPLAGGQRNDGVDIAGSAGTPVIAAAAGEVVYAGSSVPSFGNMVLIRHDGGWVTVYAHLASLDVKMRQTVSQGQSIGAVGQSGGVSQPQLHFEVRYAPNAKDKPRTIDPLLVLPQ
jgi:murein DD-endopeptidase MepM/ murein hydrolase activator NlpD